jgi:hypothetical protein
MGKRGPKPGSPQAGGSKLGQRHKWPDNVEVVKQTHRLPVEVKQALALGFEAKYEFYELAVQLLKKVKETP